MAFIEQKWIESNQKKQELIDQLEEQIEGNNKEREDLKNNLHILILEKDTYQKKIQEL